ncbi:MAG: hypothetical protein AAF333_15235, partial [Planctomycetota bacterium]
MKIASMAVLFAVGVLTLPTTGQTVFVDEDFESYTSQSEFEAVWGVAPGVLEQDPTLAFEGNNDAFHPGGAVNSRTDFGTVDATATENLVLEAAIFDPGAGADNDRITVGLRGGPFPLFEMGRFNDDPHYAIRGTLIGNGIGTFQDPNNEDQTNGWVNFEIEVLNEETQETELVPLPSAPGWSLYRAVFSITDGITVTIDRADIGTGLPDGEIDSTLTFQGDGVSPYGGFSDLRFGGPSGISSTDFAAFDNIRLFTEAVVAGGLIGDFSGDGFVGQDDLNLILLNFGATELPDGFDVTGLDPETSPDGFDGIIGQNELNDVLLNFGNSSDPAANTIPEPTS